MCGICGVYHHRTGAPVAPALLADMTRILAHRGPDGEGFHIDGPLGLGHRRLSIVDVSGGAQPQSNEDGTVWITFNGEIYNFKSLASDLEARGHVFRTRSDTEVIVHGYEQWGDDVVLRLNGIFAFGVWDAREKRLLLARDHLGVKPLYYYHDENLVAFASELKALFLHPGIEARVDPEGLDLALSFGFVPSPHTLFHGIRKLGPGHRLNVSKGRVTTERYWHPVPDAHRERSESDLVPELTRQIEAAVERQMMSDVPIGALLSGGVDSTAVVTLMSRHSERVRTFSIGVRDAPDINELAAARATARRLNTLHEELEVDARDYADFLERAHWHLEEPCTPSALLTYFICKLAGQSVKVVLTGQGADELFGGYARYRGEHFRVLYQRLPGFLRHRLIPEALALLPGRLRWKRGAYALAETDSLRRFMRIYEVFSPGERRSLIRPELSASLNQSPSSSDPLLGWSEGLDALDSLDQLLYIDTRCILSDNLLMFGDKMSMAASVEARVPMLDLDLVGFAEQIPARLKLKHGKPKYLFKRALSGLLPPEVLRRRKLGFQVPESQWFQGSLFDYTTDLLLGPDSLTRHHLLPDVVRHMLDTHRAGRQNLWRQIFSLLSLELIYRSFAKPMKSR